MQNISSSEFDLAESKSFDLVFSDFFFCFFLVLQFSFSSLFPFVSESPVSESILSDNPLWTLIYLVEMHNVTSWILLEPLAFAFIEKKNKIANQFELNDYPMSSLP